MKKLLGILVLSLLWCNVGFADAASVKKACRDLGFEPGTQLFLDCALELMSLEKQSGQSITLNPDDCSQYKKLHKKISCKMGGGHEDDGGESFDDGGESFNEKYKTLEDVFKKVTE